MATPPFDYNESNPVGSSIVSSYPTQERDNRDTVKSAIDQLHYADTGRDKASTGSDATRDTFYGQFSLSPNAGNIHYNEVERTIQVFIGGAWFKFQAARPGDLRLTASPAEYTTPPDGWLKCNGQVLNAVSNPEYQPLFDAIENTYGGSDNTDFQVPDLEEKFVAGASGAGDYVFGPTGAGEDTHALTEAELASHTHTGTTDSDGEHTHDVEVRNTGGSGGTSVLGGGADNDLIADAAVAAGSAHQHAFTTDAAGSGNPHENRPAFLAMGWLIRYA